MTRVYSLVILSGVEGPGGDTLDRAAGSRLRSE